MRVLVCGSRDWTDHRMVWNTLHGLFAEEERLTVIEGCARGADRHAERWAEAGVQRYPGSIGHEHHPADWDRYGKRAGYVRNREMLDAGPDVVHAFSAHLAVSRGTRMMVELAEAAGVPVVVHGFDGR